MRTRTILCAFVLTIAVIHVSRAQEDNKAIVADLVKKSFAATDGGDLDEGMRLMEQALKYDPENSDLKYEIAYIQYSRKEYEKARVILEEIFAQRPKGSPEWFQLLGNAYDMLGNPKKAIETYESGIERYPKAGNLYLERGLMAMTAKDYDKAMSFWQRGIKAAPKFPSNYYWAATLYCQSSERVWGIMYGEIFMNLEPGTARTEKMSKLLYDTYRDAIQVGKDTMSIAFSQNLTVAMPEKGKKIKLPFPFFYDMRMSLATISVMNARRVGLPQLDSVRTMFLEVWKNEDAPNASVLFDWQKTLRDAGLLEAYNYWLLEKGDELAMSAWLRKNQSKMDALIEFFGNHRIGIDADHYFVQE
ncbi:MAG: Tetratricopeptide repeat family protein [Chlorobi bacterium]|nr:Tetratricopeptide repeat family protein [Chlorobiota bacterium]